MNHHVADSIGTIGILGGTGEQGLGLAYRLALAGEQVIIGSREADRAQQAAADLKRRDVIVDGLANHDVATSADTVVVAVPYAGHRETLLALRDRLAGKIVIDCVNPLGFDKRGPFGIVPQDGSAAEEAAAALPGSTVVGAFHHVSAKVLLAEGDLPRSDVLVVSDDAAARKLVTALVDRVPGLRGVESGALRLSRHIEHMTAVLISINKRHKSHSSFLVTDLDR
ncbi:NADPH-dependent F420 reductase [Saccharopolyspora shandongensis]|uniref:NADPH-dependent F420 reductase n=1 Tax=Saccharopolyspora shandongensis TaxID=418495 RepID=UPI00340E7D58